jgi:O-antigen/teichoic acid export membrane protein
MEADLTGKPPVEDVLDTPAAGGLVIRGGLMRAIGYVLGVGLSVVAVAILIRQLGAADYGRYVTVFALVTVVGTLAEAGMTNLGIREYSILEGEERDRLMRNLLGLRLALSTLGVLVATAIALAAGYTDVMVAGTLVWGAGLLLTNVQGAFSVPLASRLVLGRVTALELVRQVVTVAVTAGLALAGAGLLAFLSVPVPAAAASLLLTLLWVRGMIPLWPAVDRAMWTRLLGLTASFAVATAVGVIYLYVIVIVMSLVSNDTEVGYFGASFRVFVVVGGISALLVSSSFPVLARAARDDQVRLAYALQRLFEVGLLVGGWMALATVLGAPLIIDVVAGPGFDPAVDTLRIQGAAVFATFLLATWGFALISLHRHGALMLANAFALALSVTFSLALVPSGGAQAAGVASLIGEAGLAAAYAVALMRPSPELRPQLRVVPRVALALGLGAAAALLVGGGAIVSVCVFSAVYLPVIALLGAIPAEIGEFVRSLRRVRT